MVTLWAGRLGTFLFQVLAAKVSSKSSLADRDAQRIRKHGKDSRFDEIKQSPVQFFGAWMAQATWIAVTAFPVFAANSLPASMHPALGIRDYIGLALWCARSRLVKGIIR